MMDARRLSGKIALVTGAASGIGEAIARKFAEHGATVLVSDIAEDRGRAVATDIGPTASFIPLDASDADAWVETTASIKRDHGGLDILVNNAGTGTGGGIERETPDDHRRVIELNLTGVWLGIRACLSAMDARGGGSIISISSIDGIVGVEGLSSYVGSKFAVTGMTRSLALELGDRNIRVNSIHPGIIETPMVQSTHPASMARLEKAIARQPIKRMGRPEEIANAALFLASDESSYCTGIQLIVDGGHCAGPYRDPL